MALLELDPLTPAKLLLQLETCKAEAEIAPLSLVSASSFAFHSIKPESTRARLYKDICKCFITIHKAGGVEICCTPQKVSAVNIFEYSEKYSKN